MELQCKPSIRWKRARESVHMRVAEFEPSRDIQPRFTISRMIRRVEQVNYIGACRISLWSSVSFSWILHGPSIVSPRCSVDRLNCKLIRRKVSLSLYCDTRLLSVIYEMDNKNWRYLYRLNISFLNLLLNLIFIYYGSWYKFVLSVFSFFKNINFKNQNVDFKKFILNLYYYVYKYSTFINNFIAKTNINRHLLQLQK